MKTDRKIALGIFCVALMVRLAYLYENTGSPFFGVPVLDSVYLDQLGLRIAHGDGFGDETFFRAPLYPLLLGAIYSVTGEADRFIFVELFQHLLGALVCVMLFVTGLEMARRRAGVIAGLVAALYGPLVYYEGEILVDSVFIFLAAAALTLLVLAAGRPVRRDHLVAGGGLALGLAAITRANILPFIPVAAVWVMFLPGARGFRRKVRLAALIIMPAVVLSGAMALRNYTVTGRAAAMPSQGGINFYCGNGPGADGGPPPTRKVCGAGQYRDMIEAASVEELQKAVSRPVPPAEVSGAWYRITFRHIMAHKTTWVRLMLRKFVLFWNDCEIRNIKSWYFCRRHSIVLTLMPMGFGLIAALGLLGAWAALARRRSPAAILPVLYSATFMATIMLFFVCDRLRLPVVVGLVPLAGGAADFFIEAWSAPGGRGRARALAGWLAVLLLFTCVDWCKARSGDFSREYWMMGRSYYDRGEYGKAGEAFDKSIEHDPEFAGAYLYAGNCLVPSGRHEDALRRYREALKKDPSEIRAWNGIGVCEEKLGRPASAINAYRKAAEMSPTYAKARTNLGILLAKQGDTAQAGKWLTEALLLDKRDPEIRLGLALCAALEGRRADRLRHLDAAVALGGEQYRGLLNAAVAEARATAPMGK